MTNFLSYKRHIAVLDADDSEIESWITVRGNHIPIMKGQSKEDAVKSFIEKKGGEYKKESYGKHYVKTGAKGDEKYVDPRTDTLHREKSKVGFFGSEKEAKEYAHKLNHTDPYAGTPFAVKNYERKQFPYEIESEEKESKYDPEFESVRKNALANSNVYGGRYTQKSKAEAYKEYKKDTASKENLKKANEFVNGKPESSKQKNSISGMKEGNGEIEFTRTTYGMKDFNIKADKNGLTINGKQFKVEYDPAYHWKARKDGNTIKTSAKSPVELAKRLADTDDANIGNLFLESLMSDKTTESKKAPDVKTSGSGSEKPKQPKDIMEWSFNDVMQLPVSDPRVHKYIAKNNGLSINTVSTMAEGFGSTEDLYFEIDRISDRKGYGWDKIKSKATDSWHRLWGKK